MKEIRNCHLILFQLLVLFFSFDGYAYECKETPRKGIVSKVQDGDSFVVEMSTEKETIRLWGIDAPEWRQPYSSKAKELLQVTILHRQVDICPFYYDSYGRMVAIVYYDGVNINQFMLEKGYAWVHVHYCNKKICAIWKDREKEARSQRRGLWSGDRPVPPWKWRKR